MFMIVERDSSTTIANKLSIVLRVYECVCRELANATAFAQMVTQQMAISFIQKETEELCICIIITINNEIDN